MAGNGIKLLERVGEGGMSTVWKAWDESRGCYVAVKVLAGEFAASGRDIASFREEERVMEEMDNPGIVKAYGFEQDGDGCRMIMEYVDGYTFGDLLRRKQHVGEADCLLICESVAAALDVAWNDHGVVHCDIKPENIMINSEGVVKLTDLGIFHRYEQREGTLEPPDQVMGTPAYISPEQAVDSSTVDARADVYSLGVILFELLSGRRPYAGDDPMEALQQLLDPSPLPEKRVQGARKGASPVVGMAVDPLHESSRSISAPPFRAPSAPCGANDSP